MPKRGGGRGHGSSAVPTGIVLASALAAWACASAPPGVALGRGGAGASGAAVGASDAGSAAALASAPRPASGDRSLYARLGEGAGIERIVGELVLAIAGDPVLAPRFEHANIARFRSGMATYLAAASGGPAAQPGATLRSAHAGMGVTDAEQDAFVAAARRALDRARVPAAEAAEVVGILERSRAEVVTPRPSASRELRRVEARLAVVERLLREVLARLPDAQAGAAGPAPAVDGRPPLAPPPLPAPGTFNLAFRGPKWTSAEKEATPGAVRGFKERRLGEPTPPPDLEGGRLPDTRFVSSNGGVADLAAYEGKEVVILVVLRGFAGSVCLHCSAQVLALTEAAADFEARGARVVLVYPGHKDSVAPFVAAVKALEQSYVPRFPILLDEDLAFTRLLGIEGGLAKPTTLVIDRAGIVRFAHTGRQPADRPSVADLLRVVDRIAAGGS